MQGIAREALQVYILLHLNKDYPGVCVLVHCNPIPSNFFSPIKAQGEISKQQRNLKNWKTIIFRFFIGLTILSGRGVDFHWFQQQHLAGEIIFTIKTNENQHPDRKVLLNQ